MEQDRIITDFAAAWSTFDAELIIKHLSPDFLYDSQWTFESLDCDGYIEYIRGKFHTMKQHGISIGVEIVDNSNSEGKMLKLTQNGTTIFYRIKTKEGKVIKGDMCMF